MVSLQEEAVRLRAEEARLWRQVAMLRSIEAEKWRESHDCLKEAADSLKEQVGYTTMAKLAPYSPQEVDEDEVAANQN